MMAPIIISLLFNVGFPYATHAQADSSCPIRDTGSCSADQLLGKEIILKSSDSKHVGLYKVTSWRDGKTVELTDRRGQTYQPAQTDEMYLSDPNSFGDKVKPDADILFNNTKTSRDPASATSRLPTDSAKTDQVNNTGKILAWSKTHALVTRKTASGGKPETDVVSIDDIKVPCSPDRMAPYGGKDTLPRILQTISDGGTDFHTPTVRANGEIIIYPLASNKVTLPFAVGCFEPVTNPNGDFSFKKTDITDAKKANQSVTLHSTETTIALEIPYIPVKDSNEKISTGCALQYNFEKRAGEGINVTVKGVFAQPNTGKQPLLYVQGNTLTHGSVETYASETVHYIIDTNDPQLRISGLTCPKEVTAASAAQPSRSPATAPAPKPTKKSKTTSKKRPAPPAKSGRASCAVTNCTTTTTTTCTTTITTTNCR